MRKLLALLFVLPSLAIGQESLSLKQAQLYAVDNSRKIQMSNLNIEKAEEVVKETIAIGLPQISGSADFNNFLDVPVNVLPDFISPTVFGVLLQTDLIDEGQVPGEPGFVEAQFGTSFTASAGITLSQLLFDGSYLVGLQSTKVYKSLTEFQKEIDLSDLKKSVAEAYHMVLIAQENVEILTESKTTVTKTLEEVEAMYKEGLMKENDVDQLSLTLIGLDNSIKKSERQVTLAKQLLKLSMGMPDAEAFTLSDNLESLLKEEGAMPTDPNLTLTNLPEYKLLETNVQVNELMVKYHKSQYLPRLGGFFNHSQSAQRNEFNFFKSGESWFPNTVWGVKLEVPIFSSGMRHRKVNQAKIDLSLAELQREEAAQGFSLAASQALSDYEFAKDNLGAQKTAYDLSKKIRDKALIRYKEGIASSFELNQIESQYLEAQGSYLMSILTLLNNKEAYKKAFGY